MSTTAVIVNYNYGHYIEHTLQSVVDQSLPFDEIIIVDDASTDNSLQVIEKFVKKYPHIRLYQNEVNRGVTYTTNRAISLATQKYIAVIASDDIYLKDFHYECRMAIQKFPQVGIICSKFSYFEDEKINQITAYPRSFHTEDTTFLKGPPLLKAMRTYKFWIPSPAYFKKELFDRFEGYDENFGEYTDFFMYAMMAFEEGVCYIPKILSAIRVHSNRFSEKLNPEKRIRSWEYFLNLILKGKHKKFKKDFKTSHIFYLFESPFLFFLLKRPRYWSIADYSLWKKMFKSWRRTKKMIKAKSSI